MDDIEYGKTDSPAGAPKKTHPTLRALARGPGKTTPNKACRKPSPLPYIKTRRLSESAERIGEMWQAVQLCPGLWLNMVDLRAERAIRFNYKKMTPLVDFGVVLDGQLWNRPRSEPSAAAPLNSSAGLGGILFSPQSEGMVEIPAQKRLRILHVHVDPQVLHTLLQDELGALPTDFQSVVEGASEHFVCSGKMDPAVQTVAHQMAHVPVDGLPRRLYLEGKAMELISL